MGSAFSLLLYRGMQIDDKAALAQYGAISLTDDCATARRQQAAVATGQLVNDFSLALPETRLAFALEDVGDVDTGTTLDFGITINELQSQQASDRLADRCFSGPHGSDQEQVAHGQ
jgi:hypothetical protein